MRVLATLTVALVDAASVIVTLNNTFDAEIEVETVKGILEAPSSITAYSDR